MKTTKIKLILLCVIALLNIHADGQTSFQPVNVIAAFDSAAFFKTFKSGYITTNGIKMHYVIGGKGKQVIVLVHGFPADWYSWRKIMPVLAAEYTVIAPDLRGLGLSSKPKTGYSKEKFGKGHLRAGAPARLQKYLYSRL